MVMQRRSPGRSFAPAFGRRGPRRQLKWATDNINVSITSGNRFDSDLNTSLEASQEQDSTLVRTIICLRVLPVDITAELPANAMLVSIGIGVLGEDALGAGGAAVPNPAVAGEDPIQGWLYKCGLQWIVQAANAQAGMWNIVVDIRAQRKVGNGVPFVTFSNDPGAGTPFTMRFVGTIRTLYKLA